MGTNEIKIELDEVKEWGEKIKRRELKYETKNIYLILSNKMFCWYNLYSQN